MNAERDVFSDSHPGEKTYLLENHADEGRCGIREEADCPLVRRKQTARNI